ncbi:MAG: hypothetical protein WBD53_03655 [Xanthobacteraceae bacterium]
MALVLPVHEARLRACLAMCLVDLADFADLADFIDLTDVTACFAAVVEPAGALGVVCAAGGAGFAVEFPPVCANAGPAIKAVARSAAANFLNMILLLIAGAAAISHPAVFKHMFKADALNGR